MSLEQVADLQPDDLASSHAAKGGDGEIEKVLLDSLWVGQRVSLVVVLGYASYGALEDMPLMTTTDAIAAGILLVSMWVGRREQGFRRSANLLLMALWFSISISAFADGMSESKGLYLLAVLPCISAHLLGAGAGIRWAALCLATNLGVVVLDNYIDVEREFPAYLPAEWAVRRCLGIVLFAVLAEMQVRRAKAISWQQAWQNVALDKANATAQQASQAKSDFLARVSHEIRTPMHGLLGMTQQLKQAELSQSDEECLSAIERCAESLQSLLNDGLELSARPGQGVRVERIPFSVGAIVNDILMLFSAQAQMSQTPLSAGSPDVDLWAWGDPKRTRQVLSNLVGNALKFGAGKPVRVDVAPIVDPVRGEMVQVSVRDQGVGIRAEDQEQLFLAYRQLDDSNRTTIAGTGLGLTISMDLAVQMHGTLSVESEPGQGSCFDLRLMAAKAERSSGSKALAKGQGVDSSRCLYQKRVLVVDDNEVNRRVASLFLRSWGAQVQEAKDGKIAYAKALDSSYDLILMDLQMPVLGGIDATKAIRAQGLNKDTVIVALTANAFPEDKARCLAAGMNGHLAKPFKKTELLGVCSSFFEPSNAPALKQAA